MPFGQLSREQKAVVRKFVAAQTVHDLGAGQQVLSVELLRLGATKVVAVDCHKARRPRKGVEEFVGCFKDFKETPQVAFVSWPVTYDGIGLSDILGRSRIILYVGTNTGGTACGGRDVWDHLCGREVLAYVEDPHNTLIVYGAQKVVRTMYGEEIAALDQSKIWTFDEAERASQVGLSALQCRARNPRGV